MTTIQKVLGCFAICCCLALTASQAIAQDVPNNEAGTHLVEPATLKIWNHPIIEFRTMRAELTPEGRARGAAGRINALELRDTLFVVTAQPAQVGDLSGYMVTVDAHPLFAVLPDDVDPESNFSLETTATQAAERLRAAIVARFLDARPARVWRGGLRSGAAIVIFIVIAWLIWRLREYALARFEAAVHKRGAKLLKVDLGPFLARAEAGIVRFLLWLVFLTVGYFWLYYVMSQFYLTQPWADQLGGYLAGLATRLGLGMLHALPDLFTVAAIFVITRVFVQILGSFFRAVEAGQLEVTWVRPESARATRKILSTVVWLFALTVAYPYIPGSDTEAFKGVSVFAGLMISLGSTGLINQLVSGIVVIYSRALKSGDLVVVGETAGKVMDVGFLSTKIMSVRREEITIPNAVMTGSAVTNYSSLAGPEGAMATTAVTIGYDAPWRQVHAMLLLAASRTTGIRKQPEPFVVQRSLSDFYVEYELRFRLERADERFVVLSNLHAQIQDAFNESGVQIMSPHFEGQPEKQIVVPKSKWFATPALPSERSGDTA